MANLSAHYVTPSKQFMVCGTDLMSPLYMKIRQSSVKRYVCIFTLCTFEVVMFSPLKQVPSY